MNRLLQSEWERLWKRKTTWLLFCSIPFILLGSARYLFIQNQGISMELPQYTVAWNFPILGLSEMLITVFQGVTLMIVAFIVTEEYHTGQMRMVLIRSYSYTETLIAKFIVTIVALLLFFFTYFILSYLLGIIIFPMPKEYPLFYQQDFATVLEGLVYNFKFYGIAIFTSVAIVFVMFFVAVVSRTTTAAIGAGIGFLLFSLSYPNVLSYYESFLGKALYMKLFFTSIPMIQWQGITLMLAEKPNLVSWNFLIISLYVVIFACLTIGVIRKRDSFI